MEPKVIVICGPTCSGKTNLGILLSEKVKSEIISADSRQIYKHLNIGTAKPSKNDLKKVKHHFVDYLELGEDYSASKFEKDVLRKITFLLKRETQPIVVGGSGLYIKAVVDGIFDTVDKDDEYRDKILKERKRYGNEHIYDKLCWVDPKSASELLPQNWKRVIRALEVYHITGKPIWVHHKNYQSIEYRVDNMFNMGLVEEVKKILDLGYDPQINALNTVGYKETIEFLNGKITLQKCIDLIKRNSRRYAKRQMTWFRKDKRINWFEINSVEELEDISSKIINYLK